MIKAYILPICFLLFVIFNIIDKKIKKEKLNWTNFALLFVAIVLCVVSISIESENNKKEKYNSNVGVIKGDLKSKTIEYPALALGGSVFRSTSKMKLFWDLGDDKINIWLENGKLMLDIILRDNTGKIIARIDNNEWVIIKTIRYDKNFDNEAFEIIDEERNVILQLDYDGEKINFAGKLYRKNGTGIAFFAKPDGSGGKFKTINPTEDFKLPISPIFRYPSKLHMGERNYIK